MIIMITTTTKMPAQPPPITPPMIAAANGPLMAPGEGVGVWLGPAGVGTYHRHSTQLGAIHSTCTLCEAEEDLHTSNHWTTTASRGSVGSCCLAVVHLTPGEAIKVNSHLCASASGDVVHT